MRRMMMMMMMAIVSTSSFCLTESAHEVNELREGQFAVGTEVIENDFDQSRSNRIFIEFRHASEVILV